MAKKSDPGKPDPKKTPTPKKPKVHDPAKITAALTERMKADRVQEPSKGETADRQRAEAAGWALAEDGNSIAKSFELPSFKAALAFVAYLGELAEAADHHPDLDIRYTTVHVTLTTHKHGTVTKKDWALAAQVG